MTFSRVAVVGAGLIGGSVARRLQARDVDVVVVDPDAVTRDAATSSGLVAVERVPEDRDLVVLATPTDLIPGTLGRVADAAPHAVLVDVGSVKGAVRDAVEHADLTSRYVGTHPMAGTEHSGFVHSDADLLVGAPWAVTRGPGPVADVATWVLEHFEATVVLLDTGAHDRAVALVSHAPHVLANALLAVVGRAHDPVAAHLAAGSFRDGTRVAGRDPLRTTSMLTGNAAALGPVLDDLVSTIQAYRDALDDTAVLADVLGSVAADSTHVREPVLVWRSGAVLADLAVGDGSVLVRLGGSGLESAPVG